MQVEKLFRQSAEFCSEHIVWKLNVAHVFFMQVGAQPHQEILDSSYLTCTMCLLVSPRSTILCLVFFKNILALLTLSCIR